MPITRPITQYEFAGFEDVRRSGMTNMLDVVRVSMLSGLDESVVMAILKNYYALKDQYGEVTCASTKTP